MAPPDRFPAARQWANQTLDAELGAGQYYDLLVLAFIGAAFATTLAGMGGAATAHTDWPVRCVAAALALHAYAIHDRAASGKGRLRLYGLLLFPAALWLYADGFIHPGTGWRARESATTALTAAVAFWVVVHHVRHTLHRWFLYGGLALVASALGAMTLGGGDILLPKLAGRTASAVYTGHATGPFGTPGEFAALMLAGLFPSLVILRLPSSKKRYRMVAAYLVGLTLIGLWAANTSAGWCGLVAGLATLALFRFRKRAALAVSALASAGATVAVYSNTPHKLGLLRAQAGAAPLPKAAWAAFTSNPVAGTGTGSFPAHFETLRPAGWSLDPDTAGGLFHQVLAENGTLGALALLIPAATLGVFVWRSARKLPASRTTYDRQFDKTVTYTPEPALAAGIALAATVAVVTALSLDYARPNLAVALALALLGGAVARDAFGDAGVVTLSPVVGKPKNAARFAALVAPAAILLLLALPVLRSAASTGTAADMLDKVSPLASPTDYRAPDAATRLAALDLAIAAAEDALRHAPGNADAAALAAAAMTARYNINTDPAGLALALTHAQTAAAATPAKVANVLPLVELLRTHGRTADAAKVVDALHAAAPRHPAVVLEYTRTHLSDTALRPVLHRLLADQLKKIPDDTEARRLLRLLDLANA